MAEGGARHLQELLHRLHAVVLEIEAATLRVTHVNDRGPALLGHPRDAWTTTDILPRLFHPGDHAAALDLLHAVAADAEDREADVRVISAGGAVRWVRLEAHLLARGPGFPPRIVAVLVDITALRTAEAARREAEARLRTVVENAPVVFFALDRDGCFTLCEGRGLQPLGLRPGGVVGRSVFDVYHEPEGLPYVRRALAGEALVWLGRIAGVSYEIRHVPLCDAAGAPAGTIGVAVDVTERERAEQERDDLLIEEQRARAEAEQAEARAAFLAEASRILGASLDEKATLSSIARLAVPFLADWCMLDLVERDGSLRRIAVAHADPGQAEIAREVERLPPRAEAPHGIAEVARTGGPILWHRHPGERITPEQAERDYGAGAAPRFELMRRLGTDAAMVVPMRAHGRIAGVLTFGTAQEGRRYGPPDIDLAIELGHRAAVAVEHARLYEDVRQAVRAREEFLSVASHELRTPVTSLQLAVQSLLRLARGAGFAGTPAGVVERALEIAERQSRKMARLVGDLLDVSRIAAGRLTLQLEWAELAGILQDAVEAVREEAGDRITLRIVDVPGGGDGATARGRWDRARIEQVAVNLLSNAIKYGEGRPVDVQVGCRDGGGGRLVVADQGIGIAPEMQERIFEPFERAASARHYGGLGLGLYIVRRIVEAHGGTVSVSSAPGAGTTFTVDLPAEPPAVG